MWQKKRNHRLRRFFYSHFNYFGVNFKSVKLNWSKVQMELSAHSSYSEVNYDINFWRTKSGLEVDFILGRGEVVLEVKGSSRVDNREFNALGTFIEEYSPRKAFMVCNEKTKRVHKGITVIPWREFLQDLWAGEIIR